MAFSLYSATVPNYLQVLGSLSGLLVKAEEFCSSKGIAPTEIILARLAEDMLPFSFQVKSTTMHSIGAIEAVRQGVFIPDRSPPPDSFAALKSRIADTLAALQNIKPEEVDAFVGRDMQFSYGERHIDFTAEDFLLSFSQVNFYFHAATAYDILRWKGLAIGKQDFLGRIRIKK
jgi:uncharacterized protein